MNEWTAYKDEKGEEEDVVERKCFWEALSDVYVHFSRTPWIFWLDINVYFYLDNFESMNFKKEWNSFGFEQEVLDK